MYTVFSKVDREYKNKYVDLEIFFGGNVTGWKQDKSIFVKARMQVPWTHCPNKIEIKEIFMFINYKIWKNNNFYIEIN